MPSVQPWKGSLCSPGRPWDAGSARRLLTHVDVDSRGSFLRMDPVRPWRTIRDHAIEHVRGRGPLPKHPRGQSALWDPAHLVSQRLAPAAGRRSRHSAAPVAGAAARDMAQVRRTRTAPGQDRIRRLHRRDMVDILSRQPTAAGLAMARMNGPTTAVPRADPQQPTQMRIAGIPADGELRWSTDSDAWTDLGWDTPVQQELPQVVTRMIEGHPDIAASAGRTADYLAHVRRFLAAEIDRGGIRRRSHGDVGRGRPLRARTHGHPLPHAGGERPAGGTPLDAQLGVPVRRGRPARAAFAAPDLVTRSCRRR